MILIAGGEKLKSSLISFAEYSFSYFLREQPTLTDIELSISEGEFVIITGASGSGKSTIAYSVLGLIPFFYSGDIKGKSLYKNKDISEVQLSEHSKNIGYIPQRIDNSFVTPYVFSELAFPLEYMEKMDELEIIKKLESHSLKLNTSDLLTRKIHELSEGEKQLVSFSSATINNPDVIIADEPLANLDRKNKKLILSMFKDFHNSGKTLIITTHDYKTYLPIATRLIHISGGRIQDDTTIQKQEKEYAKVDFEKQFLNIKENMKVQTPEDVAIEIENLSFRYSDNFHLQNISFSIQKGNVIGIIGDNGSGKTTLLKILCGLLEPHSGKVSIFGEPINNISWNELTKKIGVVFQDPDKQFFESTVKDEIALISNNLGHEYHGTEISSNLIECGLENYDSYNPHSLSYGEKRRLVFLVSNHHQPDIILIDEITVGMDQQNKTWIKDKISELKEDNKTIIIISHDWDWLGGIVDSIIYLNEGRIASFLSAETFNNELLKNALGKNLKEGEEK